MAFDIAPHMRVFKIVVEGRIMVPPNKGFRKEQRKKECQKRWK